MKAIMVMFDTLSRNYLPNFGNEWVQAPNFERLRENCLTFDNFYGGSMPCMPARRELHTGNYNFLHRSWGPLEPFDHSVFEELDKAGIYTHLVTDHSHYFEDGGATYHTRYSSWEGIRGQEGDRWVPRINHPTDENHNLLNKTGISREQHLANKTRIHNEDEMPSVQVISRGLEFLQQNYNQDNWFLQLECFDPHEPFFVPESYRQQYDCKNNKDILYWPVYQQLSEEERNSTDIEALQKEYAALISMCDFHLGRILDFMDQQNMWEDTVLIVNTDHGFLLGEHNWLGKNIAPMYEEIVHIPYFMHIPNCAENGTTVSQLAQTIDIPATLRDLFHLPAADCDGKSLLNLVATSQQNHQSILFGIHGGHVNLHDGRYTYMRASRNSENAPLVELTLMPTHMRNFFCKEELATSEFVDGGRFSEHMKVLKIKRENKNDSYAKGDLLFDLKKDPLQMRSLQDEAIKYKLSQQLFQKLTELDAPKEIFERLGLIK